MERSHKLKKNAFLTKKAYQRTRPYFTSLAEELSSRENNQNILNKNVMVEIIIPTLNEGRTIGSLIDELRQNVLPVKGSILVIDGGSTDNTSEICKAKKVRFVVQKGKGKGIAMREGVEMSNADIVVFMDGDGTYRPSDLVPILQPLLDGKADMVVGSRMQGNRQKGSISTFNITGNKLFTAAINFAMKSGVTDPLSGYRALYKKTFKDLVLFSSSFEIEVEMTVEALAKAYRIVEIPITYRRRDGSNTKLHPLDDGIRIGRTLLFILMNVNPLKFFGIISLAFFLIGIIPAYQVLHEKILTGQIVSMPSVVFSSLLFMTGTISIVVGMVSELVVRSRRRLEFLINKKLEI